MSTINLSVLTRPFPKDQIRQRKGRRGKMLDYVATHAVIARLNEAFDGAWSFRIPSYWKEDDEVVVLAMLRAGGVTKQQFGSSAITREREGGRPISIGDDLKAAASDALKKCATEFGVALELYGASEPEGDRNGNGKVTPSPQDRLRKARDEILKLPGGAGIFQGLLAQYGVEAIDNLPDGKLPQVLVRCERLYRSSRNGKADGKRR